MKPVLILLHQIKPDSIQCMIARHLKIENSPPATPTPQRCSQKIQLKRIIKQIILPPSFPPLYLYPRPPAPVLIFKLLCTSFYVFSGNGKSFAPISVNQNLSYISTPHQTKQKTRRKTDKSPMWRVFQVHYTAGAGI